MCGLLCQKQTFLCIGRHLFTNHFSNYVLTGRYEKRSDEITLFLLADVILFQLCYSFACCFQFICFVVRFARIYMRKGAELNLAKRKLYLRCVCMATELFRTPARHRLETTPSGVSGKDYLIVWESQDRLLLH